ncbi:KV315 protein, partial [Polyodon spathula]|nr:KV315 protein [Polyodon spathula]
FSDGINVHQSPPSLIKSPGHSAELQCSHDDNSNQYMYWYQQTRKGALDLIGYLYYKDVKPEDKFKERFQMSGKATEKGFLTISNITAEDSAVYFCA